MATNVVTAMIRPTYGEREARVRPLFRTGILVLHGKVSFLKGTPGPDGNPLRKVVHLRPGSLLVPYWHARGGNGARVRGHLHYRNLYDAIRGQEYTRDFYEASDGEVASLRLSAESATAAIKLFLRYGQLDAAKRNLLDAALRRIIELQARKGDPRSPLKRQTALQAARAMKETDRLRRKNPGARSARVASAAHRIELRLSDVRSICNAIGPRYAGLLAEQDRIWTECFGVAWRELSVVGSALDENSQGGIPDPTFDLDYSLAVAEDALSTIDVEPYLAARDTIMGEIRLARGHVRKNRFARAKEFVLRARSGIQHKRAGRRLHEILVKLALLAERGATSDLIGFSAPLMSIVDELKEYRDHMAVLDDSSLERPVKEFVSGKVGDAISALMTTRTGTRLTDAKEALKEALDRL